MVKTQETTSSNLHQNAVEWLNYFQIMQRLGISDQDLEVNKSAAELMEQTIASLNTKEHSVKALAEKGWKLYEWSEEKLVGSLEAKESSRMEATGSASSGRGVNNKGAMTDAENPAVIDYVALCKAAKTSMTKWIKDLEKMSSKLRRLWDFWSKKGMFLEIIF